ncbi:MAG: hypothetical protein ABSE07_06620 [Methanoregula sp.]|jgi:hypothetical protein
MLNTQTSKLLILFIMNRFRIPLILQCLVFLIPLNIFMWGDWIIVNLQWAFFRYQSSPYGESLIPIYKDINYILLGQTTGIHPVLAVVFWVAGDVLLIIGLLSIIFAYLNKRPDLVRKASIFTILAGIFFGLSAIERFSGGFAIPVGVPIVIFIGWWMYQGKYEDDKTDEGPGKDKIVQPE